AVTGRVVDWDGEPVSEAEVHAYAIVYHPAGVTLSLAGQGKTNDMGEYRLFGLPAGRYLLHRSPPRPETPAGRLCRRAAATHYPGAPLPSQALPIELNWGAEVTRADVRLSRGQSYVIAGSVWDASAELPCANCDVQVTQHDGPYSLSFPQTARVSREGVFAL